MKPLRTKELREKTLEELEEMLQNERLALFELRRKMALRDLKDVKSVMMQRHNIARILTVITEKRKEEIKA
ncbi:MAG TPA: 50S ribosomal protein L29 [Fimbriimonadales bacterium]|nr:50S ribosomal protein L29 [Fimbriimonadales bacterium]